MSKFIKVTNKPTGTVILQNMSQVDCFQDGLMVCTDGSSLDIQESLEQIEAQLLRDEFAMRSMQAIQNSLVIHDGKTGFDQVAYDCTIAESAYEMADAMLKERLK